jgi:hypothetical protein
MLMKLKELSFLFKNAVETGAEKALGSSGVFKDQLTKAEAYRLYGRLNVDRWMREGLLKAASLNSPISKLMLDRKTLESVAESSNRITYLPVAER